MSQREVQKNIFNDLKGNHIKSNIFQKNKNFTCQLQQLKNIQKKYYSLINKMTQQSSKSKNNIKITQIPLSIQVSSSIGIINFLSESYSTAFDKPQINVDPHIQQITFKNAIGKGSQSQQSDEQFAPRKKQIPKNRVIIKPTNMRRKYFRVDIPVNKSAATGRNYRQKAHFVIQYGNDGKGTLTMVDDVYDSEIQIANLDNNQNKLTFEEKMKMQDAKLDARRREQKIEVMEEKKDGRKK